MKIRLAAWLCLLALPSLAAPAMDEGEAEGWLSHWGPIPAPTDSLLATPVRPPTPLWKHLVRTPYYVALVPLGAADWTLRTTMSAAENAGLFAPSTFLVRGLRGPLGNFWLPTGSFGNDRGLEYGVVLQRPHFPNPYWVSRLSFTNSTRESRSLTAGVRSRYGEPVWFEFGAGSLREDDVRYYGLGWDSREQDESEFRRHVDWVGLSRRARWSSPLATTAAVMYSSTFARSSFDDDDEDDREALRVVHEGDLPVGYGRHSSGVTAAVKLAYDDTEQNGNPSRGSRLVLRGERFWSTDDSGGESVTWGASAQHFVELWLPQRVLAIKGWYLRQYETADRPIPFTRQLNNRDPYRLRAYGSERFHATGATGATVEYRWPFWLVNEVGGAGVDAYIFGDAGQFFDEAEEIRLDRFYYSTGFGLRAIGTDGGFALRAEAAWGREGWRLRLSANQVFQFIKAGFFDGSDPLPLLR